MNYNPSYSEYRKILKTIKKSRKLMDYKEALSADEFIILRHDVEFSLERAIKIAEIECEMGVESSYFIQLTNNAYNALSIKNRKLISEMNNMGHKIGLHYHLGGIVDPLKTRDGIRDQIRIMSEICGITVDRFSIHRPVREVYYNAIPIDGIINAYSEKFFTLLDESMPADEQELEVKYIADSRHRWNYGYPDEETIKKYKKIQLLIHADNWTEQGLDALDNFEKLINENTANYIETLDRECKHFSGYKQKLEGKYKRQ
jgi:hypothetical protein